MHAHAVPPSALEDYCYPLEILVVLFRNSSEEIAPSGRRGGCGSGHQVIARAIRYAQKGRVLV